MIVPLRTLRAARPRRIPLAPLPVDATGRTLPKQLGARGWVGLRGPQRHVLTLPSGRVKGELNGATSPKLSIRPGRNGVNSRGDAKLLYDRLHSARRAENTVWSPAALGMVRKISHEGKCSYDRQRRSARFVRRTVKGSREFQAAIFQRQSSFVVVKRDVYARRGWRGSNHRVAVRTSRQISPPVDPEGWRPSCAIGMRPVSVCIGRTRGSKSTTRCALKRPPVPGTGQRPA